MPRISIAKRLDAVSSISELTAAFSLDHKQYESRNVSVSLSADMMRFEIAGSFHERASGAHVGSFKRRLEVRNGQFWAYHADIEVSAEHRNNGIAMAHYMKAITYYCNVLDAEGVYLDAQVLGPYVWPGFGFEFAPNDWALMISEYEKDCLISLGGTPDIYPETARELLVVETDDGNVIGRNAVYRVHEGRGGNLRMTLSLRDPRTRAFLTLGGILRS